MRREPLSGSELDALLHARVFGGETGGRVPPFSSRDWTALALAELVSDRTGWKYQLLEQGNGWTAIWFEPHAGRGSISTLVSSRGPTRALALCRALLKAVGSPRWPAAGRFHAIGSAHREPERVSR
jgi:hypothetical protein